jgi:hypothetical protein
MEINAMDTAPNATPNRPLSPVWYKLGAALLMVMLVVVFFVLASASERRKLFGEVPPGGAVPGVSTPAAPH